MKKDWNKSIEKLKLVLPYLDEKQKRILTAAESIQLGTGSISFISVKTKIARTAIQKGLKE